ncbi:hypothetical protein ACFP1I_19010 [Dyadobacter subterraneus]|uniref:Uncharacterized protein n=1 Tax=Dyadobacter subterraneus TaxID=2773304 RepID=A0ABR9W6H3_9BACT|nr:hypothetical protein [Dyadobacter subterraneus]MBE9461057.1 hypothetical protein [Dyadobacter subterraneus]
MLIRNDMEIKKSKSVKKLTEEEIVQRKLDEANAMLRKMDFSTLPIRLKNKV